MARSLGIGRTGGSNDWVKYDGKAGRVFIPGPEGGPKQIEVRDLCALFDFAHIRTGWVEFPTGAPPSFIEDVALGQVGPRPGDKYRRGFRVNLFSQNQLGGVREMMGNSGVLTDAIVKLFEQYDDAPEAAQGLLPAVALVNVQPINSKTGEGTAITNYEPVFEIAGWFPRPPELDAAEAKRAQASASAAHTVQAPAPAARSEFAAATAAQATPAPQAPPIAPASEFASANVSILPPRRSDAMASSMVDQFGPRPAGAA